MDYLKSTRIYSRRRPSTPSVFERFNTVIATQLRLNMVSMTWYDLEKYKQHANGDKTCFEYFKNDDIRAL
jgi:hypothetical protein